MMVMLMVQVLRLSAVLNSLLGQGAKDVTGSRIAINHFDQVTFNN
jgi:hypothetical protein